LGLYQLAFLDRVPDHAAVNETVSLAPRRARGFVNAILRSFLRRGRSIAPPSREDVPVEYLAVRHSVCRPLCRRFLEAFGLERAEAMLAAFGEHPADVTLRVNTEKITREAFLAELKERGIDAHPTKESRAGVVVRGMPVTELYGFSEGLFFVQDEASQLCVEALEAERGMQVLDLCACPGSKSFGIALEMQNEGSLLACDLHANKLSLVRTGAERLGLSIIETSAADARNLLPERVGAYDRVLCDVPCSGFGVLGKKPELRYKDPADCAPLAEIQLAIAKTGAAYLKVGGRMVYSTCTVLPEENGENVCRLLAACPELRLVRERALYPDTDGTDGFYFAVLERVK
jgi:16S rRNA (cytosine967-C5)-methyltransferase